MLAIDQLTKSLSSIEKKIAYTFQKPELLLMAFLHRSYLNEHKEVTLQHNERLEFLGDTVLGLIVSEFLYKRFPDIKEGDLSFLRSRLVEAASCITYLRALSVESLHPSRQRRENE